MRRILPTLFLLSCLFPGARVDALAQQEHVVSDSELRAVVADRALAEEGDRAELRALLDRAEVRGLADRAGVDLRSARSGVAHLDGAELQRLAERARELNDRLAGGQGALTISTTALIIVLLIVLIIVVAD